MNKIYLVTSSRGTCDDYVSFNEKAFTSEEKAKQYAKLLDKQHDNKPEFITLEFEQDFESCEDKLQEWPDCPYDSWDEKYKWCKEQEEKDKELICQMMNKKGYHLNIAMYNLYENYRSSLYEEWHPCTIESIELCE